MNEELFINSQVNFQTRGLIENKISFSTYKIMKISRERSRFFFGYDFEKKEIAIYGKKSGTLNELKGSEHSSFFSHPRIKWTISNFSKIFTRGVHYFDFNDGVSGEDLVSEEGILPTFQYNRKNFTSGAILWPLSYYHDIGSSNFVGSSFYDTFAFEEKRSCIVWRGSIRGKNNAGENCGNILKSLDRGLISKEDAYRRMLGISRFMAVERYAGMNFTDFAIVSKDRYAGMHEFYGNHRSDMLSKAELCSYKYLLALEGGDVATNFIWGAETNSILFKQNYSWEVFYDTHFIPWIHYIPIKHDLSDLEEKFEFCERNTSLCKEIIHNAKSVCAMLSNRSLRQEALTRVINIYENIYRESQS